MSELHEIVKRQFDKQAQNFSNWSVTKNIEYQKAYFDFCELSSQDTLLDSACSNGRTVERNHRLAGSYRHEYPG